jgi:hypothetical protein
MAKKSKIAKSKKLLKKRAIYLKSGERKKNRVSTRGVNRCKIPVVLEVICAFLV